jgi:DNA-binding response OmpR family regulator
MNSPESYVLVVEDDESIRNLEAEILRDAGYEVGTAGDGYEAIDAVDRRLPELLLLDLVMPRLDGWAVLEHVSHSDVPPRVLVVSGRDEIVPPGRLGEFVVGYVRKPFTVNQLVTACARALSVPKLLPAVGSRREARKSFVVEATLLSETGAPVMRADLQQLSGQGFQLELSIPVRPGDPLRIAFQIPGRDRPLELCGQVRWQNDTTLGAEIADVSSADQAALRALIAG